MSLQNLIQVYTTTVHLFDRLCPEEKFSDFINQFNLSVLKTHDVKRLHTKFCKSALRVHRKTTNFSVLHELLWFSLIHNILIRMLTYRHRIFTRFDYYFLSAYILSSCPPVSII